MKLKELLTIINTDTEFELYKNDRVGIFETTDVGLNQYYDEIVYCISARRDRLCIYVEY